MLLSRPNLAVFLTVVLWLFTLSVIAQQEAQYTQYMYNTISVNPAYAGSRQFITINSLYKAQWISLEGAPRNFTLSVDKPLRKEYLGLGFTILSDQAGPVQNQRLVSDVSYTINGKNDFNLAFGIKIGADMFNIDYTVLNILDPDDDDFVENVDNKLSPVIGTGIYLYKPKWYLGISTPNLLATNFYDDVQVSVAKKRPHFYLIAGYVFDLNDQLKLKPTLLSKYVSGAPVGVDISANVLMDEKITLGISYRLEASVNAMAGFQINRNFFLGYAYDAGVNNLANYNQGSHEFFIRYDLFKDPLKIRSPRFF